MELPPLPRELEAEPVAAVLRARLREAAVPLWRGAAIAVARLPLEPPLAGVLGTAGADLVLGLELVATRLDAEARGLAATASRSGRPTPGRVSRVLFVADDGAERFYREVERIAQRHASRLLVCRLAADAATLGMTVVGRPARVKAVLLSHKRAVVAALRALGCNPPQRGL